MKTTLHPRYMSELSLNGSLTWREVEYVVNVVQAHYLNGKYNCEITRLRRVLDEHQWDSPANVRQPAVRYIKYSKIVWAWCAVLRAYYEIRCKDLSIWLRITTGLGLKNSIDLKRRQVCPHCGCLISR